MTQYQLVDVSYPQLRKLIKSKPTLLEDGLKYINHQIFTSGGLLDLLLIDRSRSLVIVEASDVENDEILIQGLDHYDIAIKNLNGFIRAYQHINIDCGQEPRLILIAPSFSQTLKNRIKWFKIPISAFSYQCIKFDDAVGEIIPIYKEITSPIVTEKVRKDDLDGLYTPIEEGDRMLSKRIISQIRKWDRERITVKQTDYDISIQIAGKVLCYIGPRKSNFMVYTNDSEGRWNKYRVRTKADMDVVLSILRANYHRMRR